MSVTMKTFIDTQVGEDTRKTSVIQQSGSGMAVLSEVIAALAANVQHTIAIDVSAVKWFLIHSTTAVTVETNSGSAPADTLTLLAGYAYEWHASRYDAFKLGTDVTALFITTTVEAIVTIKVLYDSTP